MASVPGSASTARHRPCATHGALPHIDRAKGGDDGGGAGRIRLVARRQGSGQHARPGQQRGGDVRDAGDGKARSLRRSRSPRAGWRHRPPASRPAGAAPVAAVCGIKQRRVQARALHGPGKDHLGDAVVVQGAQERHQTFDAKGQVDGQAFGRKAVQRADQRAARPWPPTKAAGKRARARRSARAVAVISGSGTAVRWRQDEIGHLAHMRRCRFPRPAGGRGPESCPRPAPASDRRRAAR